MCNAVAVGLTGTCAHPDGGGALRPVRSSPRIDGLSISLFKPECRRESSPATDHALGRGWRRGRRGGAAAQAAANAATGFARCGH